MGFAGFEELREIKQEVMATFFFAFYIMHNQTTNLLYNSHLLNMQSHLESPALFQNLLERISALLSRENLCSSLYLAKHITQSLAIPLYVLAEERTIAQITSNQALIARAVDQSSLGKVVNEREVQIIAYPTIKIPANNELIFNELEAVLNQVQKQYSFSRRLEAQAINLTLYDDDSSFLDQVMSSLSQEVKFQRVSLYDDIKIGTNAVKQNKHQHWKAQSKKQYSLERPPNIFIRRAIESEEEEPERERPRGKESDKRRKYKEVVRQSQVVSKPLFCNEDFPILS